MKNFNHYINIIILIYLYPNANYMKVHMNIFFFQLLTYTKKYMHMSIAYGSE